MYSHRCVRISYKALDDGSCHIEWFKKGSEHQSDAFFYCIHTKWIISFHIDF